MPANFAPEREPSDAGLIERLVPARTFEELARSVRDGLRDVVPCNRVLLTLLDESGERLHVVTDDGGAPGRTEPLPPDPGEPFGLRGAVAQRAARDCR